MDDYKYTPEDGLLNREFFPTQPVDENAARGQFQNMFAQILGFLNGFKNALAADGALFIGAAEIAGLPGTNLGEQIASLKERVDAIAARLEIEF